MHIAQLIFRADQIHAKRNSYRFADRSYTWSDTADRVRRMAGVMDALGLECSESVAVLSQNSNVYCEAYFGLPLAGLRMVPVNTRFAKPELVYSLSNSGSRALLFDKAFLPVVATLRTEQTAVEHYLYIGLPEDCPDWALSLEALMSDAEPVTEVRYSEGQVAAIMYTGGTTGFPKGVMLSHMALYISAMAYLDAFPQGDSTRFLQCAPMFHVAGLLPILMCAIKATPQVILPGFDPEAVLAACEAHQISQTLLVPAMIQATFYHPKFDARKLRTLKGLAYGGSPMAEGLMRKVFSALPSLQMVQIYGQTEQLATALRAEDHVLSGERVCQLRSAGRAISAVQIQIRDEQDQALAPGAIGQICISGPNAMQAYWKMPEESAKTLRNGWIYTGDAGYLDEHGYLYLVDRVKDMIVSGGENVYSTEVESALSTHPSVATVAVIGIPDDKWGESVHAIVIPKEGEAEDAASLMAHCRERIAAYKCPKSFEFRHEPLPLTGAGKVLKRELRAPYWKGRERLIN